MINFRITPQSVVFDRKAMQTAERRASQAPLPPSHPQAGTRERAGGRGQARHLAFASLLFPFLAVALTAAGCTRHAADAPDPAASAAASDSADKPDTDALPSVSAATVHLGAIDRTLPLTGTLVPLREREAAVGPTSPGIIDALPVRVGEPVAAGQVVAHLSTRALLGQIDQAEAAVAQNGVQVQQAVANAVQQRATTRATILEAQSAVANARATLAAARASLTSDEAALANARQSESREQTLFSDGLVAEKDVETAQLAVRTAEAEAAAQQQTIEAQEQTVAGQQDAVAAAKAAGLQDLVKAQDVSVAREQLAGARGVLTSARSQVALSALRSPINGIVTAVGAGVGESVDVTTKVVTIADLTRLQLQIAVPSGSASQVAGGEPVLFTVDAAPGREFRTMLRAVGTQVDPTSNSLIATADVDNPRGVLRDDMSASVRIVTGRHLDALLIPRAAVLNQPATDGTTATSVMRIGADGAVHQTPVSLGIIDGQNVEILSGLHAGDRVATTGAYGLADGAKVHVASDGDGGGAS